MATKSASWLPLYQSCVNNLPIPRGHKKLRLLDKYIILVVLTTFTVFCICVYLFLPNVHNKIVLIKTLSLHEAAGDLTVSVSSINTSKSEILDQPLAKPDEIKKLQYSIKKEKRRIINLQQLEKNRNQAIGDFTVSVVSRPEILIDSKTENNWEAYKLNEQLNQLHLKPEELKKLQNSLKNDKERILKMQQEEKKSELRDEGNMVSKNHGGHVGARGGEPSDPAVKTKRNKIKEMMLHAWHSYEKYAWGANELRPVSKHAYMSSIFGPDSLGATIVDAVDTLYIMELDEEYAKARDWISHSLNFDVQVDLSVFETNIRFLGGLLSSYALTGDQVFKKKAKDIGDRLLPAFNTPTGLPFSIVNLKTGSAHSHHWIYGGMSVLSEVGSNHLEFDFLSTITGDSIYRDKVMKLRTFLRDLEKPDSLYMNYIHPQTGRWGQRQASMGSLGDSFYEYLLKEWLISNKEDTEARKMYDDAMKMVLEKMLVKSSGGLTYFAEYKEGRLDHKMEHLACFSGGMIALSAEGSLDPSKYMAIGEELAHTCHESYIRSAIGLGPEIFHFEKLAEAKAILYNEQSYILRPEVVETWFYLWRLTRKQKYRDWAWDMVLALEMYCRAEGGYSGIIDVYKENPKKDDVQQSFFLAETLKYLYLIFSEDSLLPLDKWVFNTEAHPLPVKGVNAFSSP